MKTNRRGFTVTELVIVIVVIAILAAVLIPTFVSLVNKANQSADVQAARQMNTALQAESAAKKPETLETVINILEEAGFDAEGSLKPITKNHVFYWFKTENVIMLVNEEDAENPVVVYPTEDKVTEAFAAITYPEGILFNLEDGFRQYVEIEVETAEDVVAALGKGQSVTLTKDVEITQPIAVPASANTTIDLNGKTLTTTMSTSTQHHYAVQNNGTVTLENGTLNARGVMNYGKMIVKSDVVINALDNDGGGCFRNKAGAELIIEGGTFNVQCAIQETVGSLPVAIHNAGGTVVVNGGTFTSNCMAYPVQNESGSITINDAKVTGFHGAVWAKSGEVVINGGTFTGTNGSCYGLAVQGNATIKINGGTFRGPSHDIWSENGFSNFTYDSNKFAVVDGKYLDAK